MIQGHKLSFEYSPVKGPILHEVSFELIAGDRVALAGPNGAGKSTLLGLIAGRDRPMSGSLIAEAGLRMGYLGQEDTPPSDLETLDAILDRAGTDEPAARAFAKRLSHRVGLTEEHLGRPASTLSLGEWRRAEIVGLLLHEPDLLLLDEPTNHLDIQAIGWLGQLLRSWRGAVIMVSHDRWLMDELAGQVWVLEHASLKAYRGNYSETLKLRQIEHDRQSAEYERQQQESRRLRQAAEKVAQAASAVAKRPTGRTYDPKHKAFYLGVERRLDQRAAAMRSRVEQISCRSSVEKPHEAKQQHVEFSCRGLRGGFGLSAQGLSMSFGDRMLFENCSVCLGAGERLAITGPNGCGKTTLLKVLLGELQPDGGTVGWGAGACWAYLSQGREQLPSDKTVLEALEPANEREATMVRALLGRMLIRGDDVHKRVGDLSVGERTKVELVKLMSSQANVLILDEPTNHLDLESLAALEGALGDFPGAVIFVSHDRRFVEHVATTVIALGGQMANDDN